MKPAAPETDPRRLFGWSSVSQAGYALIAVVVVGRVNAAAPALILFFLVGCAGANTAVFSIITELRGRTDLDDYRGLGSSHPWLAAPLAVSLLSLVGIPPLVGFVGKLTVFTPRPTADTPGSPLRTPSSRSPIYASSGPMYFETMTIQVAVLGRWAAATVGVATVGVITAGVLAELLLGRLNTSQFLP